MESRGTERGSGSVRRLAIADVLNDGPPYRQSSAPPRVPHDGSPSPYQSLSPLPPFNPGPVAPEIAQQRGIHHWAHSDQLYYPPTYVPRGLAPPQTNVMNSFNPEGYMTHANRPQHFIDQCTCLSFQFPLYLRYHKRHDIPKLAPTSFGSSLRKGSKFARAYTNVWPFYR